LCSLIFTAAVSAQAGVYWDANGTTAGAGTTPTGTWGVDAYWNNSGGNGTPAAWSDNFDAYFSAGTDATSTYTVNVSGVRNVASINFEEGNVTLQSVSGGSLNFDNSARAIAVAPGRTAIINAPLTSALAKRSAP